MMVTSNWRADPALTRTYTNDIPSGLDWLEENIGIEFGKVKKAPYPREWRINPNSRQGHYRRLPDGTDARRCR